MLRFKRKKNDNKVVIISVYELDNKVARKFENSQEIKSWEWSLCEVCCKKTTKHCKYCDTLYCCKDCQIYDWKNHEKTKNNL